LLVCLLAMVALAMPASALASSAARAAARDAPAEPTKAAKPDEKKKSSKKKSGKKKSGKKKSSKKKSGKKKSGKKKSGKKKSSKKKSGKTESEKAESEKAEAEKAETNSGAVPEPPAGDAPAIEAIVPITVKGKLSASSRDDLTARLQTALATARVDNGPYRVRMKVALSKKKKRNYTLTLTVLLANDKAVVEVSGTCKGCKLAAVGDKVDVLVVKVVTQLASRVPGPGELTVASVPLGATVSVDGKDYGLTPQQLKLEPGEHTVQVTKPGFEDQRQTLEIEADSEQRVELELVKVVVAPAEPPKESRRDKKKTDKDKADKDKADKVDHGPKAGKPWMIAGGVVMGLGVAGVLTGVALILIDEDPMPLKCSDDEIDFRGVCSFRYNTLVGGIVGAAAGGLGIGAGIALMVKGHRVTVRARGGGKQAALGVGWRF
jgi:hypothetical protein